MPSILLLMGNEGLLQILSAARVEKKRHHEDVPVVKMKSIVTLNVKKFIGLFIRKHALLLRVEPNLIQSQPQLQILWHKR
jgi:hypothetical protein